MASRSGETMPSRFRARTVRGEPYKVGDITLTPEARVIAFGRARANIGAERISGLGAGFAYVTPVSVVVGTPEGDRRVPIVDATAAVLWRLGAIAAAILLLGACTRWLARRL
jgi:hypothetical protein